MGDTGRADECGLRDPADSASSLDDDPSEPYDDCELVFLTRIGRRFGPPEETTNFFDPAIFFFDGDLTLAAFISNAGTIVLPDEGMSPLSSGEPAGDMKRAVGRGPVDDDPLGFFKIGCDGGGLEALDICRTGFVSDPASLSSFC